MMFIFTGRNHPPPSRILFYRDGLGEVGTQFSFRYFVDLFERNIWISFLTFLFLLIHPSLSHNWITVVRMNWQDYVQLVWRVPLSHRFCLLFATRSMPSSWPAMSMDILKILFLVFEILEKRLPLRNLSNHIFSRELTFFDRFGGFQRNYKASKWKCWRELLHHSTCRTSWDIHASLLYGDWEHNWTSGWSKTYHPLDSWALLPLL